MGLLIGISIKFDIKEFSKLCFEKGLLVVTAGTDVVRLLPPLNVTNDEIDEAIAILQSVISEISVKQ